MALGVPFSASAQAAPGDLDLAFSGDGKQRTDFGSGVSSAAATVRQPDGKIVAVGGALGNFALARYNPDGSLDTSFSGNGRQRTDFGGDADGATGVALQADGKIVVVGDTGARDESFSDFAFARYNPNGSLDASFSGDGKQTTDFGDFDLARGVALQANGKIVAVGVEFSAGGDFALARYNPNGTLDPSFSGDGKQTTDFLGGFSGANGVALQGDGKIVAAGGRDTATSRDFALARYNPNGTLDPSFSGDGRQTTDFGDFDQANGVALQANGKIVAVGRGGTTDDFTVARYNPNGSLDTSFSSDGKQTTDFGDFDQANGVALQGDGKIVAVGIASTANDFALARYNPNGTLDPSFSGDGKQTTDFGGFAQANGVALQADSKIVAVGFGGASAVDFALARYNPNGTLDTSFSGDGKQTTNSPGDEEATGVALQTDGKIVAVGHAGGNATDDFALARYNPDGSLDTSFSGDGRQTTDFFGSFDQANAAALQSDGKIVVVGRAGGGGFVFALARYNPNGTLDTSFSGDGKQTTDFGGAGVGANAVALQANGKIVVVGDFQTGSGGDFALARYNPNGTLDTSFSGDGKQTTDFGEITDRANGIALQADGKIVAVGGFGVLGPADDFLLARYNPNGSLDTSFSGDGRQTTDFGGAEGANGVVLQGGKIVAVGGGSTGAVDFLLARYNPNGSLDPSFSGDGKQTTDVGGFDQANGVALQGDGKIVAVGVGGADNDFALARYNPNGTLDPSFSGDGSQTTNFGGSDAAHGVALQANGEIVAVGVGLGNAFTYDFALARYLGG
jgi:uncharacterized delta-60 repeat protein